MAAFNTRKSCPYTTGPTLTSAFTCTRDESLRFENGQFVIGQPDGRRKPLMRAYSVASANWEEH